ncbi:MAG: endonuclease/exonuclease/phosphatase family protein, partial [Planctomycetota bacterium]
MKRLLFAFSSIILVTLLLAFPQEDEPKKAHGAPLRLMTANLTSGNQPSYDLGHGTRILKALQPDIILIQEFNVGKNSPQEIQAWIQATFGAEFTYYRENEADIPNGIISRFPIIKQGEWDDSYVKNRDFAWACIDIPGSIDLWVVSVHLLTASPHIRNQEASQLVRYIQAEIPVDQYLVIGGDFNTQSRSEPAIQTLGSVIVKQGPYPEDQSGNGNTNANRNKPYDWLFADGDLQPRATPTKIGTVEFPYGLIFDSRRFQPLSVIPPVQQGDSNA